MVITYEAYFKIALYPAGVKGFHFEEEINEFGVTYAEFIKDYNDFNKYLCSDYQSTYVLQYLRNIYKNVSIEDVIITDLIYETAGKFNCIMSFFRDEDSDALTDDSIGELIENTLWSTDKPDGITIIICGEAFSIDICLDYFVCNNAAGNNDAGNNDAGNNDDGNNDDGNNDDGNDSESEKVNVEEERLEEEDIRRKLDRLSEIYDDDDISEYNDDSFTEVD